MNESKASILALRSYTGLSGDMLLAGFGSLACNLAGIKPDSPEADNFLYEMCARIAPPLAGSFFIRRAEINGICAWQAQVDLPHGHEHRGLYEIQEIIGASNLSEAVRERANRTFSLLAECEGACHGIDPQDVHFHELGAWDSILDICGVCELYESLGAPELVSGPLPMADGQISCCHGLLPCPAPATLALLPGIAIRPFDGDPDSGELVTPTALALLHVLGAKFGAWPECMVKATTLVYGQREFADVANGVIFVYGLVS